MNSITTNLKIFLQFLRRDIYVQMQHISTYLMNYVVIQPLIWSLVTGYLQANTYFGTHNVTQNTILFSGTIVIPLLMVTFINTMELLFDLTSIRYVEFQITILPPVLIIIERILFSSLLTFAMVVPFYPISKLLLNNYLDTSNANWFQIIILLYFGALCCSAYHLMTACIMKNTSQITSLWKRCNSPMIDFGGMWIPWVVMYRFSPTLGYLAYCNPLIYITDGLKQAMIGGPEFMPVLSCIGILCLFTIVFTTGAWYFFKKRTDCL